MVLSRRVIEETNALMIVRGIPDGRDNLGYNVPDYKKLSSIWFGATNDDLYEIASRVLKYYDTQLSSIIDFTKDELIESIKYYEELSKKNIVKNSVTIGFENNYEIAIISFKYNTDYINVLRPLKYSYNKDAKVWEGNSRFVRVILENLSELRADVEYALNYVLSVEEEQRISFSDVLAEEKKVQNILEVTEVDEDTISLKFDFDNDLVNEINNVKSKKFDWDSKLWLIDKFEAISLYGNIQHMDYDFSQLKPYINSDTIPVLKVLSVDNDNIEVSFPFYPEVVDLLKKLTFYKFNRQNKSWIIDIREKDLLVKLIEDLIDCSALKSISKQEQKTIYKLRDLAFLERKPYIHQIEAAEFLLSKKKAIIGDEMGTGKSYSSLLASYSMPSPRLIICPASLKLN